METLDTKISLIYFPKPMTNIFLKLELKQRLKLIKTLGLQKALQNPLRRKKSFMNSFLKGVPSTVNSNTKIVKIFSKK